MSSPVIGYPPLFADELLAALCHRGMKYNYLYYPGGNLSAPSVQTGGLMFRYELVLNKPHGQHEGETLIAPC